MNVRNLKAEMQCTEVVKMETSLVVVDSFKGTLLFHAEIGPLLATARRLQTFLHLLGH